MGKYSLILIIALAFGFCYCSKFPNEGKTYYFYYLKDQYKRYEYKTDTSYHVYYSIYIPYPTDSFLVRNGGKFYELDHFRKYSNHIDTFFVKHKSVLDTIDYFDSKWIKKEKNLEAFWCPVKYGGGFTNDSLRIFIIEPIEGTDSLLFRRVHRNFIQDID